MNLSGAGSAVADLVQESNLSMMAYIGQRQWLNNYEWKDKIKEGNYRRFNSGA